MTMHSLITLDFNPACCSTSATHRRRCSRSPWWCFRRSRRSFACLWDCRRAASLRASCAAAAAAAQATQWRACRPRCCRRWRARCRWVWTLQVGMGVTAGFLERHLRTRAAWSRWPWHASRLVTVLPSYCSAPPRSFVSEREARTASLIRAVKCQPVDRYGCRGAASVSQQEHGAVAARRKEYVCVPAPLTSVAEMHKTRVWGPA
eukprot:192819-Chlamydomonas_euryale.AAC.10